MTTTSPATHWIRGGLLGLAVYGLLVSYTTRTPQPDPVGDPDGWARFVSTPTYLAEHLASSVLGTVLVILGTIALGAHLISIRAARAAITGMVLAVTGQILFAVPAALSTFATPAIGAAYLAGAEDVLAQQFPDVLGPITGLALLLTVAGNLILAVAIWRSDVLPRWTAATWAAGTVTFYLLGAALGMSTTGASLPTQPIGGALLAISAAGFAFAATRRHHAESPIALRTSTTPAMI